MDRPAKAWPITADDTPAARASPPICCRKPLKSPPHRAACAGTANSEARTAARARCFFMAQDLAFAQHRASWSSTIRAVVLRGLAFGRAPQDDGFNTVA